MCCQSFFLFANTGFKNSLCYNWWQCAPRIKVTFRPPGSTKRSSTIIDLEDGKDSASTDAFDSTPSPPLIVALRTPAKDTLIDIDHPVHISWNATGEQWTTALVTTSIDGGDNYQRVPNCLAVPYPAATCTWNLTKSVDSAQIHIRVIVYNADSRHAYDERVYKLKHK